MARNHHFYVYIMASDSGTLYVGVTNNLERRVSEHKNGFNEGFTKRYICHRLIYFEEYSSVLEAIAREKQIKRWRRKKKENLIKTINHSWKDLTMKYRQLTQAVSL